MECYEVMENLRNERTELMPGLIIIASAQSNWYVIIGIS